MTYLPYLLILIVGIVLGSVISDFVRTKYMSNKTIYPLISWIILIVFTYSHYSLFFTVWVAGSSIAAGVCLPFVDKIIHKLPEIDDEEEDSS